MSDDAPVTIVGSGLAGTLLACYPRQSRPARRSLREATRPAQPWPRRRAVDQPRPFGPRPARPAAKSVWPRTWSNGILMRGRMIHARDGSLAFQPYGKDDSEALHSVSRAGLNLKLVEAAARYSTVSLHFEHRCTGYRPQHGRPRFVADEQDNPNSERIVIGADGAYSAVRSSMQNGALRLLAGLPDPRLQGADHPAGADGALSDGAARPAHLAARQLHDDRPAQPRRLVHLHALLAVRGPEQLRRIENGSRRASASFSDQFPDAVPLIPTLAARFPGNPTGSLVTIRCRPWHVGDASCWSAMRATRSCRFSARA